MKVFLSGRVAVEADGVVIEEDRFPGRQARLLFAYLAAEQGRPVPRDELAEALWGADPPATWEKALTVLASRVRAVLDDCGLDGGNLLTSAFGCYRLGLPDGSWIDAPASAAAIEEAEDALSRGDVKAAKAAASVAESLTRQTFLPGEDGSWVEAKRRELVDVRGRALSALASVCLRSGDPAAAALWAEQAIALSPFRETDYRLLMTAHSAAGNRAEALHVYEHCRRLLAEELGTYPSPETETIYRGLLEAPVTPAAAAQPPGRPAAAGVRRKVLTTRRAVAGAALASMLAGLVGLAVADGRHERATVVAANSLALIGADGRSVRERVPLGQAATSVAVGDGAVWTVNSAAGTVLMIDPRSGAVKQTITVGAGPSGIAIGGGGVWVANHDDGTVAWINPQSRTVVRNIGVGSGPTAVAYGFGSVWVTNADDRSVSRIDPTGRRPTKTIPTGAVGRGIAVGGGSVWVTDESTRAVVQIDPTSNTVAGRSPAGTGPTGIAYGNGAIWVANALDDTVSQIDAKTLAVLQVIPVAGGPSAVAFADGNVWVSAEFSVRILRIDPKLPATLHWIRIGNRPEGLAAGDGGVWVAVQSSGRGHYGGRLLVLDSSSLGSIDPAVSNLTTANALLRTVYDGLTNSRPVAGSSGTEIVPDLATALPQPSDNGRSYTFHLRPGIRYSDGTPLQAEDFRRSLEREFTLGGWDAPALARIVGASRCKPHRPCNLARGVIVRSRSTLTLHLTVADPYLLYALAPVPPVPAGTPLKDMGSRPIPSTGAYQIESYVPGRLLTIVRNPHFRVWSPTARPRGYPDEIVYRIVKSPGQAVAQVLAGKADLLTESVPSGRVSELAARYPKQLHTIAQQSTAWLFVNVRRAPFDDIRVRRALSYALDRARMAELHGGPLLARPTCQILPPTVPGYVPYCPFTVAQNADGRWTAPDIPKARRLIAASKTKGAAVEVWTTSYFRGEGRYLVALLRQLGYRARLHYVSDLARYFAAIDKTSNVQVAFGGWFGAPHAIDFLGLFACRMQESNISSHFCAPHVDAQLARLANEGASPQSARLAARIDRELVDRAPVVPLYTPRLPDLTSARVGNYQASPYGYPLFDQMWLR